MIVVYERPLKLSEQAVEVIRGKCTLFLKFGFGHLSCNKSQRLGS